MWTTVLPFFAEPPGRSLEGLMDTSERRVGAGWVFVIREM